MIDLIELLTVLLGIVATSYPLSWAVYFRSQAGIGRVISHMLFGEAYIMSMALWFSFKSYMWEVNTDSCWIEALVRNSSFLVALITTALLVRFLRKTQQLQTVG